MEIKSKQTDEEYFEILIKIIQEGYPFNELQDILNGRIKSSLDLQLIDGLYSHVIDNTARPFVPAGHRKPIFESYHSLAHAGIKGTTRLITSRFVWPSCKKNIRDWVLECQDCQRAKVTRHNRTQTCTIPTTGDKFSSVHIDLVGPLPLNQGYSYLLTMIDRFSRWPEVMPLKDIKTKTVTDAFLWQWVSRCGVPDAITSDRGSQFESRLFKEILSVLGIERHRTCSYHPQSNGLIERFHRSLKDSLRATGGPHNWLKRLPMVMLGLHTAIKEDIGLSSSDLLYGCSLRLPADLLIPSVHTEELDVNSYSDQLRMTMQSISPAQSRPITKQSSYLDPRLDTATHVMVYNETKRGLQNNYKGPYKILKKRKKYFTLQLDNKIDNVSIDRLKAAILSSEFVEKNSHKNKITKVY